MKLGSGSVWKKTKISLSLFPEQPISLPKNDMAIWQIADGL